MKIGFDYDGTLDCDNFNAFIKDNIEIFNSNELYLVTTRPNITESMIDLIKKIGLEIPKERMFCVEDFNNESIDLLKSTFLKRKGIKIDLFFDNDPWEILQFQKDGINALYVFSEIYNTQTLLHLFINNRK